MTIRSGFYPFNTDISVKYRNRSLYNILHFDSVAPGLSILLSPLFDSITCPIPGFRFIERKKEIYLVSIGYSALEHYNTFYYTVPTFNIKHFVMHKVHVHNKAISYLVSRA